MTLEVRWDGPVACDVFLAERIPNYVQGRSTCAGILSDGELVAAVAYSDFNGAHMQVTIAGTQGVAWLSRRVLRELFSFPFETHGCKKLTALISEDNLTSLNLCSKLGFSLEALVRYAAHDGGNLIIMALMREDCRWL
jgi:ribosomal-protein-serine acetyltransferase